MLQAVMNLFTSLGQRGRELMNNPQAQQLFSAASKAVSDMRATRNENDEKIEKIGDTRLKKMLKLDNNAQFSCHSESSSSGAVFYAVFLPEAKSIWKSPDEKSVRLLCSKLNPLTDVSLDKTQMAQRLSALMEIHWKEPDWAAIHYAVACGFTSYLTTMIKKDPEIVLNYATADGRFPLNIAAQTEQLDSLRLLLNAGAPLNQSDASGRTVVHWAAASSATILKELSSSPSFQPCLLMLDGDGMSPLAVAIRAGNLETVKLLMGVSAPLGALSSGPLLNAVVGLKYNDNIGKILELITTVSPKVVEQTDGNGRTVLHKALDKMILMCILRSSHQHIDVNRGDKSGNSALHLAVERDELATTVGLLTYGADVNTTNANGETPLMKAAKNCSIMLVKCLLLFDARLDVKNTSGQDVFKYSESNRQRAEVDSLLNFAKTGAGVGPAELDAMEQFSQKLAMEYHASQKPADGKPKTINVLSLDGGGIRGLSLFRLSSSWSVVLVRR